jgi:hypothetical protein
MLTVSPLLPTPDIMVAFTWTCCIISPAENSDTVSTKPPALILSTLPFPIVPPVVI